jgi:hypothetical protein
MQSVIHKQDDKPDRREQDKCCPTAPLIKQHMGLINFGRTKRTPWDTDNALEKIGNA